MEEQITNGNNQGFSLKKFFFGKINRKFMFILGIILFAIILIGALIIYFQNQVLQNQFFNAISENEEDFFGLEEENIRTLSAALEVVLQDSELKQLYLEKDRGKLFDYGQSLFQDLKDKYQITHFYFIGIDGINFVRLHNKDVYGDEIKRATFLKAKETKDVGAGIELGKTAYALRVVMPYYNSNELIGYVELGQEIDEFLEVLKRGSSNEFSLVVEKSFLSEEDWRDYRKNAGLRDNWGDLGEQVVIGSTTDEIFSCFSSDNFDILREQTSLFGKSKLEDKIFACGGFAIIDVKDEKSGAIFSLIDVTDEQTLVNKIKYILLSILGVVILIFLGIGYYVSSKISKPIKDLGNLASEIEKKNFKTRVNIKTGDELENLGDTFNEAVKSLENMDAEHKQLEKAKTEFLSITSHELRSPMTPMQAQLQMLMGDYYGKLNEKQKQALDIVARNTKRLDSIIVDFLEISRIEAARLKFRFVKEKVGSCIPRLVKEMQGFMPEKKIKIVTAIGNLPIIEHDPDRLCQVLRNLINNAVKFSKPNTIVKVSAKLDNGMILFSVADQGIGIKSEEQKRIFEPFFQAEQTMYREHQGTGLGLAIIRGIVESQNGKVWLKSEVGKGTVFYFTLPLKPVRKIKPIKLLFSQQESSEKKIKSLFREILGPMGDGEFENLKNKNQLDKKGLLEYINLLQKKGIFDLEKGQIFKRKILGLFEEALGKVGSSELFKSGLIAKSTGKVSLEDIKKKAIDKSSKVKKVYIEILGARGDNYFRRLTSVELGTILPQIDLLEAKSVLTREKSEVFKNKIKLIFK